MHVDLTVFSFFENVVLMVGWIVNNAAWHILNSTMIAALPFFALVVGEWYTARREGEDEGNKGLLSLNRIETTLYAMILIYAFTAFPLMSVQFAPANIDQSYQNSCDVRVVSGPGSATGGGAALGGQTAEMPIWWAVVHAVSMGLTNTMIAALPCQTDYQYIQTQLNNTAIQDPKLRQELSHFQVWCYGAARAKLFRQSGAINSQRAKDTDWLGSQYFLNTSGYYDTIQAKGPVKGFAYNATRDSGRGTAANQGGYPMCKQWWSAGGSGLKARLRDQIDPSFMNYFQAAFSSADAQDYAIRALLNNQRGGAAGNAGSTISNGTGGNWFSGLIGSLAGAFGVGLSTIPAYGMQSVAARAMPMVQYLVLMAIVIAMPFVIVFSRYSFKAAGLVTFTYFGTVSLTFWFELSHWLQNHLVDLVYNSQAAKLSAMAGLSSAYDQGVMGLVQAAMLFFFPPLWMAMLGWAGYSIGSGISNAVKTGSGDAAGAGKKGGEKGQSGKV